MLTHKRETPHIDGEVVVLGSTGFLGRHLLQELSGQGAKVRGLGSTQVDLTAGDAAEKLEGLWGEGDSLVLLSAITPDRGRGIDTFMANLCMARAVCAAVQAKPPRHLVYLSSDAVYPFGDSPISETSAPCADDLYGAMHWAREVMLRSVAADRLAVVRSTLLFGAGDPHNSYGPNRLRRMARDKGEITLFGGGEETRDHVDVDDAARLLTEVLAHESVGLLNLASGSSDSYNALARKVADLYEPPVRVVHTPRQNPETHRHFDITGLRRAFPSFAFTDLGTGLGRAHDAMVAGRDA